MSPPHNFRETRRCVRRCRQDYTAAMATRDDGRAVLRPRISPHKSADPTVPTDQQVASHLVVQAARRLEIVSSVALMAVLLLWLLVNFFEGEIANELASPAQWAPPIAALTSSAAMLLIARSGRWSSATLIRIGLVYEVVMSVSVACGAYLVAFQGLAASDLTNDLIGVNGVVPWTMFFTVLVPARPREALIALVISNAFVPLLYLQQVHVGAAPALSVGQFLPIFVLPYAANTVLAYVAARVVHSLGVEYGEHTISGAIDSTCSLDAAAWARSGAPRIACWLALPRSN